MQFTLQSFKNFSLVAALLPTRNEELEDIESLKRFGREMVKTYRGLPLAVLVLGGILASKNKLIEWEAMSMNFQKDVRFQKSVGEVILALSYYELPYYLKPCFLYLSVLSEDECTDGDTLYNLWIAEGMVFAKDNGGSNESSKEVAKRYMGELVKRCMVMEEKQPPKIPESSHLFYLHDLMRDMCREKAREENFMKVLDYGSDAMELEKSISNIPRVMINSLSLKNVVMSYDHMDVCRSLRALEYRARNPTDLIVQRKQLGISKFMMLRSLIIEGVMDSVAGNKMADGVFKLRIGKLIHLRQLSLRYCQLVMSPSSLSSLEHLEILDLHGSIIMWTNKHEIKVRRLRQLCFPLDDRIDTVPTQIICVPNDLEVIGGPFPNSRLRIKNLSQLTNVRELGYIIFENHHQVNDLGDMLKCILNSHHLKAVVFVDVTRKLFMEERGSVLVRELLSSNVQSVYLDGPLSSSTLPDYDSHIARNLNLLRLANTCLEEDPMKILEMFPHLQMLWLEFYAGEKMVCHSMGFTQLKILKLIFFYSLETWIVEKGAMPNLSQLEIISCYKLKAIPEELGSIPALKKLVVNDMPEEFVKETVFKFSHVSSVLIDSY